MDPIDLPPADLSRRQLSSLSDEALANAYEDVALELSKETYTIQSSSLYKFKDLKSLKLDACGLCEVPEDVLNLTKLEQLSLTNEEDLQLGLSFGRLQSLKELFIGCSGLISLPESFGSLKNLETLKLIGNNNLHSLCSTFGLLQSLRELWITDCRLKSLPDCFGSLHQLQDLTLAVNDDLCLLCPTFGQLQSLKEFRLIGCGLTSLPDTFGTLNNLERLTLTDNAQLTQLCSSFGHLRSLKFLSVVRCGLTQLPDSFGNLEKLEVLIFRHTVLTNGLCSSFGNLPLLKDFQVQSCGLTSLPDSFGRLRALESLEFADNKLLESLCSSFGQLPSLRDLTVKRCPLKSLPESFGTLHRLVKLTLLENNVLENLCFSFGGLSSLRDLRIECCSLKSIPESFKALRKLEKLELVKNTQLTDLGSSFGGLRSLKDLVIKDCSLRSLPESFGFLRHLEKLKLTVNRELASLCPFFGALISLKELWIGGCHVNSLPESFGQLSKLEKLTLADNKCLESLCSSFGKLQLLRELHISGCCLPCLPPTFGSLHNLKILTIEVIASLRNLSPAFGQLKSLEELQITGCGLTCLPTSFGALPKLHRLSFVKDEELEHLTESFGDLKSLKYLTIKDCGLKDLPDSFGTLDALETIFLDGNHKLARLCSTFGELRALKHLRITGCALKALPKSFENLHTLRTLDLSSNCFEEYPQVTLRLNNLETLDLSNSLREGYKNNITMLPSDLADSRLSELKLDGNPIIVPPPGLWRQGLQAIKPYMKQGFSIKGQMCADSINMIGDSEAGKTSIAQSLYERKPSLAEDINRTNVMQQFVMTDPSGITVNINDFGGHPIYHSVIPIFLPSDGLVILAYSLKSKIDDQKKQVKEWLLTAAAKSTSIRVVITGTRGDLVPEKERLMLRKMIEELVTETLDELKEEVKCRKLDLSFLKEDSILLAKLNDLETFLLKLKHADVVSATVNCGQPDGTLDELRGHVLKRLRQAGKMPSAWCQVMNEILKERSGLPYLNMKEIKEIYSSFVKDDSQFANLTYILRYLVSSSQIIWIENNRNLRDFVFYAPTKVTDICRTVLDETEVLKAAKKWISSDRDIVEAYQKGILREGVLGKLLSLDSKRECDVFVNLLTHFNLIAEFELNNEAKTSERSFIIPGNLKDSDPECVEKIIGDLRNNPNSVQIILRFYLGIIPMSFFETTMVTMLTAAHRLARVGLQYKIWKDVLIIQYNGVKYLAERLVDTITLTAGSSTSNTTPWSLLLPILTGLHRYVSLFWTDTPPKCVAICPVCRLKGKANATSEIGEIEIPLENICDTADDNEPTANKTFFCTECFSDVDRRFYLPDSRGDRTDMVDCSHERKRTHTAADRSEMGDYSCERKRTRTAAARTEMGNSSRQRKRTRTAGLKAKARSWLKELSADRTCKRYSNDVVLKNFEYHAYSIATSLTKEGVDHMANRLEAERMLSTGEKEAISEPERTPTDAAKCLVDKIKKKKDFRRILAFLYILETELRQCKGVVRKILFEAKKDL